MRLNCAKIARLGGAALLALCLAGCQSNSERDLIARDRRMQEDQMWAMQDYMQQYQHLVCQFRSENAALRRQLNIEHSGAVGEREPQPAPRVPSSPPGNFPEAPRPSLENKQAPSPNIEMPDIPPLKQGTSIDTSTRNESFAEHESGHAKSDRY